jgi:hypothetical protein
MKARVGWFAAATSLFLGFVFLHWPVTLFCERLIRQFGFAGYQRGMAGGFAAVAVVAAISLFLRRTPDTRVTWPALIALFAIAGLFQRYLILINVEQIHLVQYAGLAMLLGGAGLGAPAAWLAATGLGVLDETYQFRILRMGTPDYLDWNDITFNALGAALGVVILLHFGAIEARRIRRSWTQVLTAAFLIAAVALFVAPPTFVPFYTVTPAGLRNHVLSGGEGVTLVIALFCAVRLVAERVAGRASVVSASALENEEAAFVQRA